MNSLYDKNGTKDKVKLSSIEYTKVNCDNCSRFCSEIRFTCLNCRDRTVCEKCYKRKSRKMTESDDEDEFLVIKEHKDHHLHLRVMDFQTVNLLP